MSGELRVVVQMDVDRVSRMFTRSDGTFRFARWARPLAPVIFFTDDQTLGILKDALREVATLASLPLVDADPELGVNLPVLFCRDWSELLAVPDLDRVIPDLDRLVDRLGQAGANQYRSFRFDPDGAIRFCAILLRMDDDLAQVPAQTLGASQMVQSLLLWSDTAFREESPVGHLKKDGPAIVTPEIAALIRAAYDQTIPSAGADPALAFRLAARAGLLLGDLADDP